MTKLEMDSALGEFGIVVVLSNIIDNIPDPIERELLRLVVEDRVESLSEEDLQAFTEELAVNIADAELDDEDEEDDEDEDC